MSSDSKGDVVFECLRCGKTSILENSHVKQPKCARCGSGSGVLGDIGQGSPQARRERAAKADEVRPNAPVEFDCLTCGHMTMVTVSSEPVPQCVHCGSLSGILIENYPKDEGSGG